MIILRKFGYPFLYISFIILLISIVSFITSIKYLYSSVILFLEISALSLKILISSSFNSFLSKLLLYIHIKGFLLSFNISKIAFLNIAFIWFFKFSDLLKEELRVLIWAKLTTYFLKYKIIFSFSIIFCFKRFTISKSVFSFSFNCLKSNKNSIHFSISRISFVDTILLSLSKDNSFNLPQSSREVLNKKSMHSLFLFNSVRIIKYFESELSLSK